MNKALFELLQEDDEFYRLYDQEELIVKVAETIYSSLEKRKVSRSELAAKVGKSNAFISQLLSGSRNMTLRTLADIAHALDLKVGVELYDKQEANGWIDVPSAPVNLNTTRGIKIVKHVFERAA